MNDFIVSLNGSKKNVKVLNTSEAIIDGEHINFDLQKVNQNNYVLRIENRILDVSIHKEGEDQYSVAVSGKHYTTTGRTVLQEKAKQLIEQANISGSHLQEIKSPMPGMVLKIKKRAGDKVKKGESVIILEAMKMENDILSPKDGVIVSIISEERTAIEKNVFLFSVE